MMGYLDDELDDDQQKTLQQHLDSCPACTAELEEFSQLKQITDDATLAEPEEVLWKQYWGGVYNRIERGAGWVLFSVASILLLMYGGAGWARV